MISDKTKAMRILFIASDISPFNPRQGAEQRSCLLLQACLKVGNVDVINFCEDIVEDSLGANLLFSKHINSTAYNIDSRKEKIIRMMCSFLPSYMTSVDRRREEIIDFFFNRKSYDFIVIRYAFPAINCGLYKYADKLIVDIDDNPVDKVKIIGKMSSSFKTRFIYAVYAHNISFAMKLFEGKIHRALYSNPDDCKSPNARLLPNVPYYENDNMPSTDLIINNRLLFVGDMEYTPNIEAVNRFLRNVYVNVISHCDAVSFHIVGKCQDSMKSKWEAYPGVSVMGFVPSLKQEYSEACLFVLPMYNGCGTCIKFLEAAQMGRPIISTECGFRGYSCHFTPNVDCCIATDDNDFSQIIIDLLSDEEMRNSIAKAANDKYQKYYSRRYFNNIVQEILCI